MIDLGIKNSIGQSVVNPIMSSWLSRADAPVAPVAVTGFSIKQTNAMLAQLAYTASQWNPKLYNGTAYTAGRYQFTSDVLANYNYINQQFYQSHGASAMTYTVAWTGVDSMSDLIKFLGTVKIQDRLAAIYMQDNYDTMLTNGTISLDDDLPTIAGMLFVAQLLGLNANQWRIYGTGVGPNNINPISYFNAGRYAISVLSA